MLCRRSRACAALVVAVLVGASVWSVAALGAGRRCRTCARPPAFIISVGALRRLVDAGLPHSLLLADFNRPSTLLIGAGRHPDPLVPRATRVAYFTSAEALIRAVSRGGVPKDVPDVLLDLERWPLTPAAQQRQPILWARRALAAAHRAGKRLIFTPALDLLGVLTGRQQRGRALQAFYDRLLAGPGARASDIFEIQAQATEGTAAAGVFAPRALRAVQRARPGEPVFVGLSTNPSGRTVTAADLYAIVRATPQAAGYWLNVPQGGRACPRCGVPRPGVGVALLERLAHGRRRPAATVPPAPSMGAPRVRLSAEGGLLAAGGLPADWILAASQLPHVLVSERVRRLVSGGRFFEPISPRQLPTRLVAVIGTAVFHSERLLAQQLQGPGLGHDIGAVLYDNERFANTPADEQADPGRYDALVSQLARQHGLLSICDLILPDRLAPAARTAANEVPPCDFVGLNTVQQSERDPARYAALVERYVTLVHSVAPGRPVLAGLSANPAGPPVTAGELARDIELTAGSVSGFWLNVPAPGVGCPRCGEPDPALMTRALSEVAADG